MFVKETNSFIHLLSEILDCWENYSGAGAYPIHFWAKVRYTLEVSFVADLTYADQEPHTHIHTYVLDWPIKLLYACFRW